MEVIRNQIDNSRMEVDAPPQQVVAPVLAIKSEKVFEQIDNQQVEQAQEMEDELPQITEENFARVRKRNKMNQESEARSGVKTLDQSDMKQEDHDKSKVKITEEIVPRKVQLKQNLMKEEERENQNAKKRSAHHEIEFTSFCHRESITLQSLRHKLRDFNDEVSLQKTVKKMNTVLQKIKNTRIEELISLKFESELLSIIYVVKIIFHDLSKLEKIHSKPGNSRS